MANREELARLLQPFRDSFIFYAPRALKIRTKAGEIVPLKLNRAQQYAHERIEQQLCDKGMVRSLILKGRQQGMSTYVEGRMYWRVSMNPGKRAFIMTHLAEATANLFGMTKRYHDNAPLGLQPQASENSKTGLRFNELDSEFSVSTAGSKGTGRSATAQFFHASEFAFWDNAAEHLAGIGQIVPTQPGTEIIIESTANGVGNAFHAMCVDAMRGEGDYQLIFVPWFWQEEYRTRVPEGWQRTPEEQELAERYGLDDAQLAWRRAKIRNDFRGDEALFGQEYPCTVLDAFRHQTTESYIPPPLIQRAREATKRLLSDPAAPLRISSGPKIMGVDPAEYGDDSSAIAFRQGRVVSRVMRENKRGTMELVGIVAREADAWGPDAINVDATGIGSGVADRLRELGYPVNRVQFGERPLDDEQYVIRKDELWGESKKWLEDEPCRIPDDDALEADACGPTYTYDSSRRLRIEPKESMKKRGLKSPDGWEAVALTFAVRIAPQAAQTVEQWRNRDRYR